ncbi:MAG: putative tricarboxylic transport rane protein [Hyphomicrobiales bacterium]|jgi:tripartite-type tricarboxylate transporter receptor subunit TctC|nr:putative tricarboxylic transport rane protein [Hyphomicrobiales bacterium]
MRSLALLFSIVFSLGAGAAHAETYPSRPITLLVPAAAGGGNDTVSRVVAEKMGKLLGQQIVIENRPGAGGSLAARQVARSEPDGYTIGIGNPAVLAIAPAMLPNVGYDPVKDFEPVGMIAASPHIILINNFIPAKTLAEFIALAKAEPGKYTFASGGAGSPAHLGPELLASIAGIKLTHVPYKGTGPAIADLLGGHVSMTYSSLPPTLGLIREGKVRPIAIASPKRSALLPDVPTASETLPGYESTQRYGIIAPAHTPPAIVAKLNAALREALGTDDVKSRVEAEGAETTPSSPQEYAADIATEAAKWGKVIRQLGLKAETNGG